MTKVTPFGKWRRILWPIHQHEWRKFLPMFSIFFFLSLSYNLLKNAKDTVMITSSASGAQVIPFIKLWIMFPAAVFFAFLFAQISKRYTREKTFYLMLGIFWIFFALFLWLIYPYQAYLTPTSTTLFLHRTLPHGWSGFIDMIEHWPLTLFYVMSELWGSVIVIVAFWGFANEVTPIHEAKRFYAIFSVGSNLSGFVAAQASLGWAGASVWHYDYLPSWHQILQWQLTTVLLSALCAAALFYYLNTSILEPIVEKKEDKAHQKKKFSQGLSYLLQSPYLLSIAFIVMAFGFTLTSVEVLWKNQIAMLHPDPRAYSIYTSKVTRFISILSTVLGLLITNNVIRLFGWTVCGLITPILMFVASGGFFLFLIWPHWFGGWTEYLGYSPLQLSVFFGSMHNVISRGAKYTIFDATKEMAFIPLTRRQRLEGKAAIDGIVAKLGKSSASGLQAILITFLDGLGGATAPSIAAICMITIVGWMGSISYIGLTFKKLERHSS